MAMVMTILEAHVPADRWAEMREAYEAATGELPAQMTQTFLLQSTGEPTLWQMTSVWKSRAALEEYRGSVETPGGVLLFRSVGVEPALSIFDVAVHATAGSER
jgi:quinol monooxygenase YgiN